MLRGVYLENITWKDAEEAFARFDTVVIPLGAGLKEHGYHLPLNNDLLMANYLTRRVTERLPVLVTPAIPYYFFPAFAEYPGSVSIEKDTAKNYVIDICRSLHAQGAKKFYVLNTGYSTIRALEPARLELAKRRIQMEYTDFSGAKAEQVRALAEQEGGTHADEIETSIMLYIAPEVVKLHLAEKDFHQELDSAQPGPLTRDPQAKRGVYSPTGAYGDPTLATREKGKLVVETLVDDIVAFLEKFASPGYAPEPAREQWLR